MRSQLAACTALWRVGQEPTVALWLRPWTGSCWLRREAAAGAGFGDRTRPGLSVETSAEHVPLGRVRTTCFCCGWGVEQGCLRAGASKGQSRGCSPASSPGLPVGRLSLGAARAVAILRGAKSKAPRQPFAAAPSFGCGRTNCPVARRSGAEPSLRRARVFPSSGKRPRRSVEASGRKGGQGSCASQLCGKTLALRGMCVMARENRPASSARGRARSAPERLLESTLRVLDVFASWDDLPGDLPLGKSCRQR